MSYTDSPPWLVGGDSGGGGDETPTFYDYDLSDLQGGEGNMRVWRVGKVRFATGRYFIPALSYVDTVLASLQSEDIPARASDGVDEQRLLVIPFVGYTELPGGNTAKLFIDSPVAGTASLQIFVDSADVGDSCPFSASWIVE